MGAAGVLRALGDLFAGDPTPIIGGSTIIALVGISVTLLFRTAKVVPQTYIDQIDALEKSCVQLRDENTAMRTQHRGEIAELRASNARCDRKTDILIRAMQRSNVAIPEEIWTT